MDCLGERKECIFLPAAAAAAGVSRLPPVVEDTVADSGVLSVDEVDSASSGCGDEMGEQKGVRGYRCGVRGARKSPAASLCWRWRR